MKINLKTAGIGLLACVSLTSKGEKPNIIYILADDLGYARPVMAFGEHPREIIVHASGKDRSKYDPKIDDRSPQGAG